MNASHLLSHCSLILFEILAKQVLRFSIDEVWITCYLKVNRAILDVYFHAQTWVTFSWVTLFAIRTLLLLHLERVMQFDWALTVLSLRVVEGTPLQSAAFYFFSVTQRHNLHYAVDEADLGNALQRDQHFGWLFFFDFDDVLQVDCCWIRMPAILFESVAELFANTMQVYIIIMVHFINCSSSHLFSKILSVISHSIFWSDYSGFIIE